MITTLLKDVTIHKVVLPRLGHVSPVNLGCEEKPLRGTYGENVMSFITPRDLGMGTV